MSNKPKANQSKAAKSYKRTLRMDIGTCVLLGICVALPRWVGPERWLLLCRLQAGFRLLHSNLLLSCSASLVFRSNPGCAAVESIEWKVPFL
jgi:hypothetical protein